jgi:DNA-binding transcriptional LysR family regulator
VSCALRSPSFVGIDYASRVGAKFLQRYPNSRLDIRLVDNVVHPVKDGFDVVFGTGPLQDSTLIARKVFSLELFLCASPDFVRRLKEPVNAPTQLNTLPFIDCGICEGPPKLTVARNKRRYELSPMVRARANNFQVCKQYILHGLGVGAMPNQIILTEELREGSIVPVLPDWGLERIDVYMIHPEPTLESVVPTDRFRAAVQEAKIGPDNDIPHITAPIITKYITDLQLLGLL